MAKSREEEEMALDHEFVGSLEEKISAFFSESSSNGSDDSSSSLNDEDDHEQESEDRSSFDPTERAEFWLGQYSLLQEILSRVNSSGLKLRREVKRAVKMEKETGKCRCPKPNSNSCALCLRRAVINHLHAVGYDAALCTSSWKSTREIPGGKHEYIDVTVHAPDGTIKARFVVELEFRAEFEMAKAYEEYQKLTSQLPESFVGKPEHLNTLIRVVCGACKRSMTERKIHMGPWRKRKFMQMKWAASSQRRWLPPDHLSPVMPIPSQKVVVPTLSFGFCSSSAVEVA